MEKDKVCKNKKRSVRVCFCMDKKVLKHLPLCRVIIILKCLIIMKDKTSVYRELRYVLSTKYLYVHNVINIAHDISEIRLSIDSIHVTNEKLAHMGMICHVDSNERIEILSESGRLSNICYRIYAARGLDTQYSLLVSRENYGIHVYEPFVDAILTLMCILLFFVMIGLMFVTQLVVWY